MAFDDQKRRFERALGAGPEHQVPRLDAATVQHDASAFYRSVGDYPVMLTNALPDDSTVRAMTLDSLAAHLAGGHIEAYSHMTGERENVPAELFFRALRYGPCDHNVVDHPVDKTPLHNHIGVPECFQSNWLPRNCNEFGISPLSLTVSPAGNFTPMHVDGYGMQGWMLLLHGCKHWRFVAPEHARLRMDPTSAELPSDGPAAWEGVPRFETIARRGDLVFIPPGWAHQVLTIEPSVGVGGSVINAHQFIATMTSWLAERALGCSEELDVAGLGGAALDGLLDLELRERVERGVGLHAAWERKSSTAARSRTTA